MDDIYRPSFFELVAQDQLRDFLLPIFRYVLANLTQNHPRYLLRIFNRTDEVFAVIMLVIERHYLVNFGASFAESFYDLKRRKRPAFDSVRSLPATNLYVDREKLRTSEINLSLLFLVALPYLQTKAKNYHESLGGNSESDDLFADPSTSTDPLQPGEQEPLKVRLANAYKKSYPYMSAAWNVWMASYNIRYLFERTPYYRPWLSLMGVDVRRMSMLDHKKAANATKEAIASPFQRNPLTGQLPPPSSMLFRFTSLTPRLLLDSLRVLLPASIFLYKFLEWWYSSDRPGQRTRGSAYAQRQISPALNPPAKLQSHPNGILSDTNQSGDKNRCPLCKNSLTNPTALDTGYVFDYKCIWQWVNDNGSCPVTLLPCSTSSLRKIIG